MYAGISSINDAMSSFLKPEYLTTGNEWKCDKCLQRVKVGSTMCPMMMMTKKKMMMMIM